MSDPLKNFCSNLATRIGKGGDASRLATDIIRGLGIVQESFGGLRQATDFDGEPALTIAEDTVGIWKRKGAKGFVRTGHSLNEWGLWANVTTIPAKSDKRRIVLVGESVGRGFLYDPVYTPAISLQRMLNQAGIARGIEVIDLARTSLRADDLVRLLESAVQLEPDAFVIFAGNNWREEGKPHSHADCVAASSSLRFEGVPGLQRSINTSLMERARSYLARYGEVARRTNVPVLLLAPEFNLRGWRPASGYLIPALGESKSRSWMSEYRSARAHLEQNENDLAERSLATMLEIDEGTSVASLSMMAECKRRKRQHEEERNLLERARDASLWSAAPQSPRSVAAINKVLVEEAESYGVSVVNLPQVFREWLSDDLPDSRVFLDYCHYNSLGIRVAMAAAARTVIRMLGGRGQTIEELYAADDGPGPQLESEALFAAAIHGAHHGQPIDVVKNLCRGALGQSPDIARVMRLYAEMQVRRSPSWLCNETRVLSDTCSATLTRYIISYAVTAGLPKLFDDALVTAIGGALEQTDSRASLATVEDTRISEYGLSTNTSIDLLEPCFAPSWSHADWWLMYRWDSSERYHYYRSYSPTAEFVVVSSLSAEATLRMVTRKVGANQPGEPCSLFVNGECVHQVVISNDWQALHLKLPLKRGTNTLRLVWSDRTQTDAQVIGEGAALLERGRYPNLCASFGDVHSLSVGVSLSLQPSDTELLGVQDRTASTKERPEKFLANICSNRRGNR